MNFQNILYIEWQERTWVSLELDIDMHSKFLIKMLLVNNKVAVYSGLSEL